MSRHEPRVALIAGVWLATAAVANAATETTSQSGGLEEVIVTAQKRAENEQTVPMSITTFSATTLQQKAITEFFDYATKVPNLAFAPTGDGVGTARTISIRGITGIAGDGTTGFYIDDVPLPDSIDPRVLDLERIEVLRGPQGTLYGARSMGGTVRLITQTPDLSHFSATVHGGLSDTDRTDRPNYTADAVVNIPIVQDQIALRLTGFYDYQAGYFKRSWCTDPATAGVSCFPLSTTGRTTVSNVAALDTYGGSASLTIKAGDAVTITPRIMMQRADYNGFPLGDFNKTPENGIGFPVPSPPATSPVPLPSPLNTTDFTQARFFDIPEGGSDWWDLYSLTVHWNTGVGELVSSTAYFDRTVDETEDESEFVWAALVGGGAPSQPGPIEEIKDYQSFVQEIRFASTLSGPLQFVVGGFYSDFHGRIPFASLYPPATVPGIDDIFNGGMPGNSMGIANLIFAQDYHTDIQEPAVFGELYYNITPALKATAGLRWYQVKATSHGYEAGYATGAFDTVIGSEATTKQSGTNPKFELDYQFAPDQMVYGLASKGFRPGGVVPIVPPGTAGTPNDCVASLAAVNPNLKIGDTRSYQSDSLWNYELGTKNTLLDHRLILNAAAFDIRWSNIQQQILLGCGFQFISNAGAAESKGGEIDLRARATDHLEVSLGIGYNDAKITEKGNSPQPVGSPVFQVPDWTGNGALTYTLPITSSWNSVSVIDYSYVGSSYSANNIPQEPRKRPAYRLLNARFAFAHGATELALVGKNLTNEVANLADNRSIAAEVPGRPRLFLNQPRTIGIEVTHRF
jgi:outer membrane receptor protein involved in Fe transport